MKKFILAVVMSFLLINTIKVIPNNIKVENTHAVSEDYCETNDEDDGGTRG